MIKAKLVRYEQDWAFFARVDGLVDDEKVFSAEYKMIEGKTIVWTIDVVNDKAIELSELIYNWDDRIYTLFIRRLIEKLNETYAIKRN